MSAISEARELLEDDLNRHNSMMLAQSLSEALRVFDKTIASIERKMGIWPEGGDAHKVLRDVLREMKSG